MIIAGLWLFQLVGLQIVEGFSPFNRGSNFYTAPSGGRVGRLFNTVTDPHQVEDFEDWTEDRKSNLFQFLLRDLEVEGVPLLACDGVSANKTLQGATWTIAGQLSENEYERKVCLVLEDIPVKDLKAFVTSFSKLREEDQAMMDTLHDLRRFKLSLVGNGIGPAMILETQNKTKSEIAEYSLMVEKTAALNEAKWRAAMESFVKRSFSELEEDTTVYRFLGSSDVCDILSGYWNCICELEATDPSQASSVVLSFPPSSEKETHTRFTAISRLLNTMNDLYKSDYKYELFHFHPDYNRDEIHPQDEDADGHLTPITILREMMKQNGGDKLPDEQLTLQNYKRKSPLPGVVIKRISAEVEDDTKRIFESITELVDLGEEKLKETLEEEMKLLA